MINHLRISKNFWLDEFHCKGEDCCDHLVKIDSQVVNGVQKLRNEVDKPLLITSGYRCSDHNKNVGGQPNSYHLSGLAADVTVTHFNIRELARLAFSVGFGTVIAYPQGILKQNSYRGFIHLDVRKRGLGLVGG